METYVLEEIVTTGVNLGFWHQIATISIALVALVVSVITAWVQIRLQRQEWRPYLSYVKTEIVSAEYSKENELLAGFKFHFKNVGKCILRYEFKKLDITYFDGEYTRDFVQDGMSIGHILSVNAEIAHESGLYASASRQTIERVTEDWYGREDLLSTYEGDFEIDRMVEHGLHNLVHFEVDFIVEYWKVDAPQKKYTLAYDMLVHLDKSGDSIDSYLKTHAD